MLPSALDHLPEIVSEARDRGLAVFLDYDGTLTPIVSRPEKATLSNSTRQALRELADLVPVAILSGRDLDDVRRLVDIDGIVYAGSHGFDIAGPRDLRKQVATEFLSIIDLAEKELKENLAGIPGALVERKRFSIAAHYRNAAWSDVSKVEQAVNKVAADHGELRRIDNKKVYELQPNIAWNKGKAVLWLLQALELHDVFPIYIGDDLTDEDVFRALEERGAGIVVNKQPRLTAARYALKDPMEVERFLRDLSARLV
ncbi:MAG TPA: trehalose-phosphatase [Chthoniobacterales bacterium]|nr:trehalose-phosphatase [Chthoniobacterales bacterium]